MMEGFGKGFSAFGLSNWICAFVVKAQAKVSTAIEKKYLLMDMLVCLLIYENPLLEICIQRYQRHFVYSSFANLS
jgi:hypothetical protein